MTEVFELTTTELLRLAKRQLQADGKIGPEINRGNITFQTEMKDGSRVISGATLRFWSESELPKENYQPGDWQKENAVAEA